MKLEYYITREDYADFSQFYFIKYRLKRYLVGNLMLTTGVIFFIVLTIPSATLSDTAWVAVFILLVYGLTLNQTITSSKNIPMEDGSFLGAKECEFTEAQIMAVDKHSESKYNWSGIKRLEESKKAFYLYTDTLYAILIPKRTFSNETEMDLFRDLVNRKVNGG